MYSDDLLHITTAMLVTSVMIAGIGSVSNLVISSSIIASCSALRKAISTPPQAILLCFSFFVLHVASVCLTSC